MIPKQRQKHTMDLNYHIIPCYSMLLRSGNNPFQCAMKSFCTCSLLCSHLQTFCHSPPRLGGGCFYTGIDINIDILIDIDIDIDIDIRIDIDIDIDIRVDIDIDIDIRVDIDIDIDIRVDIDIDIDIRVDIDIDINRRRDDLDAFKSSFIIVFKSQLLRDNSEFCTIVIFK